MNTKTLLPTINSNKVVASWTGGKDGCFACYKAILGGFDVSHLLYFKNLKKNGSHEINPHLLLAQSQVIGIPIVQIDFISYEEEFKKVVRNLRKQGEEIGGAVFGHIKTHKNLVDRICSDLEIELLLPLWMGDSEQIINDFIEAGFEAIIVGAKADVFDKEWLGRPIDTTFLHDLHRFNSTIDPCGEYGEFHSFVLDGPMFKRKLTIIDSKKILKDGYWFLDISAYAIEEK